MLLGDTESESVDSGDDLRELLELDGDFQKTQWNQRTRKRHRRSSLMTTWWLQKMGTTDVAASKIDKQTTTKIISSQEKDYKATLSNNKSGLTNRVEDTSMMT